MTSGKLSMSSGRHHHIFKRPNMTDSFNRVYGQPDDPFYYGLKPSKKLELFLNETHPPTGEALDLGCGEGRNSLLLAHFGYRVHAVDSSSQGLHKLEKYARSRCRGCYHLATY